MTEESGAIDTAPEQSARDARIHRRLDLAVALFFLILGLIVLQQVWTELPLMRMRQVGPGMLPFGVGCILVAMSSMLVWQNLRGEAPAGDPSIPTLLEGSRVVAVVVMLVAAIGLAPVLGTLVTLCLFIFLELRMVERRSPLLSIASAVLITLFIYVTFEALLGVALPAGVLGLR